MDRATVAAVWVGAWSLATFALAAVDKRRAQGGGRRIREDTLVASALFGGSPGLVLAMLLLRHKVRKASFLARFLVVVLLQAVLVYAYVRHG